MDYSFFKSDFAKASKFHWDFIKNFRSQNKWNELANQYQDSFFDDSSGRKLKNPIIPKKIHQIWIGPKKLPNRYKKWMKSWKKFNPKWEYYLWDEEKINKLDFKNKLVFNSISNPGFKSDIARYEILNKFGGIYLDTDFQCLKPIPDSLLYYEFVSCLIFDFSPVLANGMIMSKPKSSFLKNIINSIYIPKNKNNNYEIFSISGPYAFTEAYFNMNEIDKKKGIILPSDYFYPFPNFLITSKSKRIEDFITEKSIGLHHWEMSWMKGSYLQRVFRKFSKILKSFLNTNSS